MQIHRGILNKNIPRMNGMEALMLSTMRIMIHLELPNEDLSPLNQRCQISMLYPSNLIITEEELPLMSIYSHHHNLITDNK